MPEPIRRGRRYAPGLDGLRAIAVLGVLAYHLGFAWMPGGLLGVSVFFTLSGYLITDLLLGDAEREGIRLGRFWLGRARRLLPALVVMLVLVTATVTVIGPEQPADFRAAVASALGYVNNWWLILREQSYFEIFAEPSPVNHLWSLAVEEQFYLLWPLILLAGTRLVGATRRGVRLPLAAATILLAFGSTALMALLYEPTADPSRVYYGTDTRASELLVGASLAMVYPSQRLSADITAGARRLLDGVGLVGLVVVLAFFWQAEEFSTWLYRGGFLALSVATAAGIAALVHPASRLARVIGCRPARWIGVRSYGIYLWHFPIIALTPPDRGGTTDLVRAGLQVAATFAIAAVSWRFVEDPIRRHGLRLRHLRPPPLRWAAVATTAALAGIAVAGLAGWNTASRADQPGQATISTTVNAVPDREAADATACDAVIHIGDSTSEGLESGNYLPNRRWRISAQYARVGPVVQHIEISGARSIYERYNGLPNAADVAKRYRADRFRGCWVLALGTNEAANVAAGSTVGFDERIATMMRVIGAQPVLWVNVRSLETVGPYSAEHMRAWNAALEEACAGYPTMRIYDWADDAREEWFIDDGIHFTTVGYRARARLIADALLSAFPDGVPVPRSPGADCVV